MRRVDLLINDVLFNTNKVNTNRFPPIRLVKYFNDAQDVIAGIIVANSKMPKFFIKEDFIDVVSGTELYDLPTDIYSQSSINSVARQFGESVTDPYYSPLKMITEAERRIGAGYAIQGKKILISPLPSSNIGDGIRINYIKKPKKLSIRVGKIQSLPASNKIKLQAGFVSEQIADYDDFFCIVDSEGNYLTDVNGNEIYTGKSLESFNVTSGVITTTGVIDTDAIGKYVVLGKMSTDTSELPDNCEKLLGDLVERKIQAVDSSSDVQIQDMLTKEEIIQIVDMFKDNDRDTKYPPVVDTTYLSY